LVVQKLQRAAVRIFALLLIERRIAVIDRFIEIRVLHAGVVLARSVVRGGWDVLGVIALRYRRPWIDAGRGAEHDQIERPALSRIAGAPRPREQGGGRHVLDLELDADGFVLVD